MQFVNRTSKPFGRICIFLAAAVMLLFAKPAASQTKPDSMIHAEAEILHLEQDRIQALIAGDIAAQERLMAPECIHIESSGTMRTTAEYVASLGARRVTFDIFVIDEAHVRFYSSAAVVTGSYHNAVHDEGKPQSIKYARFTRVWAKGADGHWRMVSHQATEMPAPENSPKSK